ncbi:hypothetical protein CROQUDRAFT_255369 [Cronartium quercuum f. sp. fusiforme G11]|uniref:Uncharacterized protein n=1 Tax=Cronartium quercuum f. sp. fusiforme G11 TaxID=708437 RepID=A0A9P6T7J3_9BASI|nr:hypothetical protein CROQUDRAFT_255369 [Cronartium quercuum f. sp. fusiforme G11]
MDTVCVCACACVRVCVCVYVQLMYVLILRLQKGGVIKKSNRIPKWSIQSRSWSRSDSHLFQHSDSRRVRTCVC